MNILFMAFHSWKVQIPLNYLPTEEVCFSGKNCAASGFAQTEPCLWPCMGFPNMFHGQSHNTGRLWGAEEGTGEMAAINNWSKESCLGVQLFTIRQPVISIACLDRSLGLPEKWGPQWLVAALPWPTMTETGCRDLFFLQKHSLLLSLQVFFFPLLSPPTCWGL